MMKYLMSYINIKTKKRKSNINMWNCHKIFPIEDKFAPLKIAGVILWTAVIITAIVILG